MLEEVKSPKEAGMIYAGVEEQKEQAEREGFGRGRMEGQAEGLREGRATLECRARCQPPRDRAPCRESADRFPNPPAP